MSNNLPVFRREEIYNANQINDLDALSALPDDLPSEPEADRPFIHELPLGAIQIEEITSDFQPAAPAISTDLSLRGSEIEDVSASKPIETSNRQWLDADLYEENLEAISLDEDASVLENVATDHTHEEEAVWETFNLEEPEEVEEEVDVVAVPLDTLQDHETHTFVENHPSEWMEKTVVETENGSQPSVIESLETELDAEIEAASYQADAVSVSAVITPQPQASVEMPHQSSDESAFELAAKFLETYRNNPKSDTGAEALYWAAENYQKAGLPGKARGLFQDFVRHFPNHPKVSAAQQALQWMDVDTPSEDQLMGRPTLNDKLATEADTNANPTVSAAVASGMTASVPAFETETLASVSDDASQRQIKTEKHETAVFMSKKDQEDNVPLLVKATNYFNKQNQGRRTGMLLILLFAALLLVFLVYLAKGVSSNSGVQSLAQRQGNTIVSPPVTDPNATNSGNSNSGTTSGTATSATENTSNTSTSALSPREAPLLSGGDLVTSEGGWGWAFKYATNKSELDQLANALRARGYRAGVVTGPPESGTGQPGFRLVVGQFQSKNDAKLSRDKLPADAPADVWVVEVK